MDCTVAMWSILLSDLPPLTHLMIPAIFIKIVFQKDSTSNGNWHAWLFKFPKVRNFSDLERLPNHLPRTNTEITVTLLPISQLGLQKMPPLVTKKSTIQQRFPTNFPRSRLVISDNTTQKYGLELEMTIKERPWKVQSNTIHLSSVPN